MLIHATFGLKIEETTLLWTEETDYPATRIADNACLCTFSANEMTSKQIIDLRPEVLLCEPPYDQTICLF